MATFAFHFAHLSETPCKDCHDLPKHANDPAVTTLRCDGDDKDFAYKTLVKWAEDEGFDFYDYMSMMVEESK